jgi:hypothetical protein
VASLGDLVVNLKANSASYTRSMQAAQKQATVFAAAAGAAAAAAVVRFAQVGDQLQKTSIRTGIAVESLSRLDYVAGQSGASFQALATGLRVMAKFNDDLRRGSLLAVDAMEQLGLQSSDLAGLNPEQMFAKLADAISGIEDPLERAAAAQKVFGRGGTELLPMLDMGAAGIAELAQQADDLGAVMSTDAANNAAALTDAIDNVQRAATGAAVQFANVFAPAITAATNTFADLIAGSQSGIQVMATLAAGVAAFLVVMKAWTAATKAQAAAQVFLNALTGPAGIAKTIAGLAAAGVAVVAMGKAFADSTPDIQQNNAAAAQAAGIANDLADGLGRVAKAQKEKPEFVDRIGAKLLEMRDPAQKAADQISRFEFELKKLQQYTGMAGNIPEDVERFRQHASGYVDALRDVQDEIAVLTGQTTEQQQAFARMQQFGISGAQIAALDAEIAKRDRIIAQQREQEQAMTQAQRDADAIIQSLKTEDQLQADKAARIKELQALGLLSAKQAQAAIDALKPAAASEDGTGRAAGEFRSAGAMMAGSAEAFSTIVSAMGRRSEEAAAISKMQKAVVGQLEKLNKKQPVELQEAGP